MSHAFKIYSYFNPCYVYKKQTEINGKYSITFRGAGRNKMKKRGCTKLRMGAQNVYLGGFVFIFSTFNKRTFKFILQFRVLHSMFMHRKNICNRDTVVSSCNHGHLQGNLIMDFSPFSYF